MLKWLTNLIGDSNEKELGRISPQVERINALEPEVERLSDAELRARAEGWRNALAEGEELDALLPEVFAAVREASRRTIGLRHYDVQMIGATVLHQGKIAEMRTGEGKTLVATPAVTLNALTGRGVHVVTVNDYLAKRDAQWMGPIYHLLGLSVGVIQHEASFRFDPDYLNPDERLKNLRPCTRREAYLASITYGTNNEFGFDYLRDNMVIDFSQQVQRELHYGIVDEVDNILVDEARTPLIISAPGEDPSETYYTFARLAARLHEGDDYKIDARTRTVSITEVGIGKVERWLNIPNIYDPQYFQFTHYLDNALKARALYHRDDQYVAKDGQVIIVDEFTGRLMFGRRYSEGLHQAIEAKEGLKIQRETMTWATITFQNYFRMYEKLAGMTGTAATEAEEFHKIYKLDVVVIPTHRPMIRADLPDQIYKSEEAKFQAVAREIEERHKKGQPVLIGTTSIEKSERLSRMLHERGIPHQVLNAKFHEQEAAIIAQAGQVSKVTVATNMAGRGVDIILGGNPPDSETAEHVRTAGGLHVIGTERHEARRIDNQLRGRSGRQGDPGSSRFYLSLEDEIMRRFGGDRIKGFMEWAGLEEDVPIEHTIVNKAIENAQTKVEGFNFDIRKHVVEYDDVMNKQREVIYAERKKILEGADLKANIQDFLYNGLSALVQQYLPDEHGEHWDVETLVSQLHTIMPLPEEFTPDGLRQMSRDEVEQALTDWADELYGQREREFGEQGMRLLERIVMLRVIDTAWVEHLTAMEDLREGIGLRAYGQTDPLVAYKKEGREMFDRLLERIQHDIVHTIFHAAIQLQPAAAPADGAAGPDGDRVAEAAAPAKARAPVGAGLPQRGDSARRAPAKASGLPKEAPRPSHFSTNRDPAPSTVRGIHKIGRNDPCPCGSGKKYKKCHGAEV